jgi:hypothetical protein
MKVLCQYLKTKNFRRLVCIENFDCDEKYGTVNRGGFAQGGVKLHRA